MPSITGRPYMSETDFHAMIELLLRCRAAGQIDKWPTISELRLLCDSPRTDWEKRVWVDATDRLIGCAIMNRQFGSLYFWRTEAVRLQPQNQGSAVEAQIITWALERRRKGESDRAMVRCQVREDNVVLVELLGRQGFVLRDFHTIRMVRLLDESIPEPQLPAGFTLRHVAGEHEVEDYVAMHRDAFGTANMTVEQRVAFMRDPAYIPELDLIIVSPDGTFAAFCVCSVDQEENALSGQKEGWTDPIGTRRALRRRGLARAVLLAGLQRLRVRGMDTAIMGTGSWNVATRRLCESVGFRTLYNVMWYAKEVG
jgi:GNAT superfamily N-acetyltransferase